jgi:uncharacterized hydantoinase/oxoprolinase family protein
VFVVLLTQLLVVNFVNEAVASKSQREQMAKIVACGAGKIFSVWKDDDAQRVHREEEAAAMGNSTTCRRWQHYSSGCLQRVS